MQEPVKSVRTLLGRLGPVEQAQIVASTAVVVMMVTIYATLIATGQAIRFVDFFSIITVGLIGFTSVYFSLRHSRELESQRQRLLALNTVADSVNRLTAIDTVLKTSLQRTVGILDCNLGWIYTLEGQKLVLKSSLGTETDFLTLFPNGTPSLWLHQPRVMREKLSSKKGRIHPRLKQQGIQFWTSIPLAAKETVAGVLIVAGRSHEMISSSKAEFMESFGKQISIALNNARLFDLLRKSEEQYHDLFEHAPDSYLTIDPDGRVVACNETGVEVLQYPKEQIIGKQFEGLFDEDRAEAVRENIEEMFRSGNALNDVEEQMLTGAGEAREMNLNFSIVRDDKGSIINARVIARDITQRKKMEQTILRAQKIDSIGQLAGGVAHDFNNILASVLGAASIMRRRLTEDSQLYKYVKIIELAAHRGSSLTRQLLTFARKTETEEENVDLNGVITETLNMFERSVPKNIVIQTRLSEDPTSIRGDSGQIQQGMLNLFLNARDAMPRGGTLSVATDIILVDAHTTTQFASVRPGKFVRITVADTGVGIEKSIQSRLFEPFFTTKDNGTGLGLSVLYGVIQNHGGFIDLESSPGRGTTFSVHLPGDGSAVKEVLRERREKAPRGHENILIIDDEISVCDIARDLLTDLGYSVIAAHDGKEGLDLYRGRQGSIDLVLLDLNMPLMGGRQTLEELRSINRNTRIIILTGYGETVMQQDGLEGEADSFVQKPFQIEDLALKIRQVLDSRREPLSLSAD